MSAIALGDERLLRASDSSLNSPSDSLCILFVDDIHDLILTERELGLWILCGVFVERLCDRNVRHPFG